MSKGPARRKVGIVGFGHLGRYLVQRLQDEGSQHGLELAFVWNRDVQKLQGQVPTSLQLQDLCGFPECNVDLVVEVAHPCITQDYGEAFLASADFMVGSPTALADQATETRLREAAQRGGHTLYVPRGALWGGEDIQRMDNCGTLQGLKVTMIKHPDSFRLESELRERLQAARGQRAVLYEGPVRALCPLAPNNVNTMAAACMAASSLGFDGVQGCLITDPGLPDWHVVEVEVTGPAHEHRDQAFTVTSSRRNPASPGAVTGAATFPSFWCSLLACQGHGGHVRLC
uniref:Aspartate dehydrogenase domain-containing protein n=1 Tax=Pelusios castaneus TaxID=367368 RepID=A0A8C8VJL1_9SAUR